MVTMLVGIVLFIVGIVLLATLGGTSNLMIDIKIEGESYKAGVGRETDKELDRDRTERVGIISDSRLSINPRIVGKHRDEKIQRLKRDMEYLFEKVESELIPQCRLPEIKKN